MLHVTHEGEERGARFVGGADRAELVDTESGHQCDLRERLHVRGERRSAVDAVLRRQHTATGGRRGSTGQGSGHRSDLAAHKTVVVPRQLDPAGVVALTKGSGQRVMGVGVLDDDADPVGGQGPRDGECPVDDEVGRQPHEHAVLVARGFALGPVDQHVRAVAGGRGRSGRGRRSRGRDPPDDS